MINLNPTPKILQVDASGMPQKWISLKDAVSYYATDMVLFELGNPVTTFRGGYNRITEAQSEITTNSIIGIKGSIVRKSVIERTPKLTNESLFERDRYLCAYCGEDHHDKELSREHIKPVCQGGLDNWMNVVTACKICNNEKGGRTLEQSRMSLLYLPYVPDRYESFILAQGSRRILADQMEFLLRKVPKTSRLKQ
jgi:hypothetical protein